jgi:hypothetical protein
MRTLLVVSIVTSGWLRGADAGGLTMREKLHAKILETVPLPPAPTPAAVKNEEAAPVIMMQPVIVSDTKLIRAVTAAIDQAAEDRREEKFSPLAGGKIGTVAGMQVGGWWSPAEGWTFLRRNLPRTYRQTETAEARMKELQDLAKIGERSKP